MSLRDLEERYQDGRNIRVTGNQKRFVPYKLEQQLQGGVHVGESRCKSPGFCKGIYPNFTVFASVDPYVWGEENFTPDGLPDGDVYDPTHDKAEPLMCDMHGLLIEGDWSEADEQFLIDEFLEEEYILEEQREEELRQKQKPKGARRKVYSINIKTARRVVF